LSLMRVPLSSRWLPMSRSARSRFLRKYMREDIELVTAERGETP
jgi:hypothetical protein